MREMSTGFQFEIDAAQLSPCLLAKLVLDTGDINLWTGIGDLNYDGDTYLGAGNLIGITPVKETQNLEANGLRMTLNGIPSSYVSLALQEEYQNREVRLYFGVIDTAGNLDAIEIFGGIVDVMELNDTGDTASITVSCENELIRLRDPINRFLTPEDQKSRFPNDKGLDYVPTIQDKQIQWGL